MGLVEQSGGAIESHLSVLEELYDSFAVNQRTVAVPSERYEREREKADREIELHAKVENEKAELLYVECEGTQTLPSTTTDVHSAPEDAIQSRIEAAAGIDCTITDISTVTILGLRDQGNRERETIYRLLVVYEGEYDGGSLSDGAVWKRPDSATVPV